MTTVTEPPPALPGQPAARAEPAAAPARAVATARALAAAEARRLLRHPAFVAGIVVTVLLVWLTSGDGTSHWRNWSVFISLVLVPLGWLTLVATNLMALRDRRHDTTELVGTAPASPATRTVGLLLATLVTIPVTGLLVAGSYVYALWRLDPAGGGPHLAEVAVALFLVVGGGVVGVAVARWLPLPVAGVAGVIAVTMIQVSMTQSQTSPWRWLAFWVQPDAVPLTAVHPRPVAWHLVWLAAWVAVMAVVAVARHGLHRPLFAAATAAVLVATLAGWYQTRPLTEAQIATAVSVLSEPERHQRCETHGTVTYCAYRGFGDVIGRWRGAVDGVLAAVPPEAHRPLEVRQRLATVIGDQHCAPQDSLDLLPPEVAAQLRPERVWTRDGAVHPAVVGREEGPCGGPDLEWFNTAVSTGAWAVGLPPGPWDDDVRCTADGEARSAVALWLGAQAVPGGTDSLRSIRTDVPLMWSGRVDFSGHWTDHPQWGVAWHIGDIDAALAMLERPAAEVGAVVAENWHVLTDPGTTTRQLRDLLAIDAGGDPARPESTCPEPPT
jgi:hypothetical protein